MAKKILEQKKVGAMDLDAKAAKARVAAARRETSSGNGVAAFTLVTETLPTKTSTKKSKYHAGFEAIANGACAGPDVEGAGVFFPGAPLRSVYSAARTFARRFDISFKTRIVVRDGVEGVAVYKTADKYIQRKKSK